MGRTRARRAGTMPPFHLSSKLVRAAAAGAVLIAVGRTEGRVITGPLGSSPTDAFGRAVAGLGGGAVAVGAPNADGDGLEGAGAVYLVAAGDSSGSPITHPPTRPREVAEH